MIEARMNGHDRRAADRAAASKDHLRVVIADRDRLARRMMESSLHQADRGAIVVGASDGREALELTRYYVPEVIIIELALPPVGALRLIQEVAAVLPSVRCLTVGAGVQGDDLTLIALRAGAVGHIDKDVEPSEFGRLVRLACRGEALVPRRLVAPLLALLHQTPDSGWRPLHSRLTTREWQIVELLAEGATTDRITEHLVLAQTTVYSHIKNLMRKLEVHSRGDAVRAAERLRSEEAVMRKTLSRRPLNSPSARPDLGQPLSDKATSRGSGRAHASPGARHDQGDR
jgi:DNA-binding NarL/FixJ family response regulator